MTDQLFQMQDLKYRDFHAALMPGIDKNKIIGVRVPQIRSLAKKIKNTPDAEHFLQNLPHTYYEENNLHAFLIAEIKNFDQALRETERFLPYIDNWATCDMFFPKIFRGNPPPLRDKITLWLKSDRPYTVRYAIGLLMRADFSSLDMSAVASVKSDEYYVNMMIAWYFATALSKNYSNALIYLKNNSLSIWVHNKTISKACDSRRISAQTKAELRKLKR